MRRGKRRLALGIAATTIGFVVPLVGCSAPGRPRPVTPASLTTAQLAAGHWQRIPNAPFAPCRGLSYTSTGNGFAMVQPRDDGCPAAAALFDATSSTWRSIAAPPTVVGSALQLVWSGTQLLAVPATDARPYLWAQAADSWTPLPSLPPRFGPLASAAWWDQSWVTLSTTGQAAQLTAGSWRRLAPLPAPRGFSPGNPPSLTIIRGRPVALAMDQRFIHRGNRLVIRHTNVISELAGTHWTVLTRSKVPRRVTSRSLATRLPAAISGALPLGDGLLVAGADDLNVESPPLHLAWYLPGSGARSLTEFTLPDRAFSFADAPNGQTLVSVQPGVRGGTRLYDASDHAWTEGPELRLPPHVLTYAESYGLDGGWLWSGGALWTNEGVVLLTTPSDVLPQPLKDPKLTGFILRPSGAADMSDGEAAIATPASDKSR